MPSRIVYSAVARSSLILVSNQRIDGDFESFGKNVPFAFLNEIKSRFTNGILAIRALTAYEHEFDSDFSYILKDQMIKYSTAAPVNDVNRVKKQVQEVITIMSDNIEKIVEHGERLNTQLEKTNDLEVSSSQFCSTAKEVKRHKWCKNFRIWIIIFTFGALITLIVLMATNVIPL